ncbi:hypothetical protein ACIBCN_19915 [Nocardia sp. NPDC051052]|uniref:hypothetical protein n=1 Tax=Nocardia sp. NPDC051052 TaxID=3364322 RepID=UPI0037AD01DF
MTTRTTRAVTKPTVAEAESENYTKQRVPKREVTTSLAKQGPISFKGVRAGVLMVLALVSEQWRIGTRRAANKYSNLEAMVVSRGVVGAENIRDKGAKKLTKTVEQFEGLRGELAILRAELVRLPAQPVTGDKGEVLTAQQAEARMALVQSIVTKETDEGSLKHRRVSRWLVRLTPFATVLDLPVFVYFCAEVFNVDWNALGQSAIQLTTSAAFAMLGTVAIAVGLHFIGRDLKGFKDHFGHISLPKGQARAVPLVNLSLAIAVAVGSGIVMAFRIISDSAAAGNSGLAGAILGTFFAVIVMTLNLVIWGVNYRDGSTQTDELDHHARQLMPVRRTEQRLQKEIDQAVARLQLLQSSGVRIYDATLAKMSGPIKAADQLILQARSYHQGCGINAELVPASGEPVYGLLLPPVTVDTSVLDNLLQQLQATEDAPRQDAIPHLAVSA